MQQHHSIDHSSIICTIFYHKEEKLGSLGRIHATVLPALATGQRAVYSSPYGPTSCVCSSVMRTDTMMGGRWMTLARSSKALRLASIVRLTGCWAPAGMAAAMYANRVCHCNTQERRRQAISKLNLRHSIYQQFCVMNRVS